MNNKVTLQTIDEAANQLSGVILNTPLQFSKRLSAKYGANVYIKREDLQEVRSFKIRGAYNKIAQLSADDKKRGVVAASTGNHAQGIALSCSLLKIKGVIFMPTVTPNQKLQKVKYFGGNYIEIKLIGTNFDEAVAASRKHCKEQNAVYVHPFDDQAIIAGQATIGKEIYEELEGKVDVVIAPIGGGGLVSGIASYIKQKDSHCKMYGVEADKAASMEKSLLEDKIIELGAFDTFVDGAAVNRVGELTFELCKQYLEKVLVVPDGRVCSTMIELYQKDGIIAEPAGALSLAALKPIADQIKGKTVVCVLSGGNNDILRYPEILERSLVYRGLKHYFLVEFAQKPGQLREFLNNALGPTDDIVLFEYMKKTNKEKAPALVGIELSHKADLKPLLDKMEEIGLKYRKMHSEDLAYNFLI